jgi:hypothetical protein
MNTTNYIASRKLASIRLEDVHEKLLDQILTLTTDRLSETVKKQPHILLQSCNIILRLKSQPASMRRVKFFNLVLRAK